ncbi:hypothetical protein BGW80DRAFT_1463753 [Lactifluus volemus]|nr:hypothetical protein BGW80DRAFT_1463753 [Lactifluus volemus]
MPPPPLLPPPPLPPYLHHHHHLRVCRLRFLRLLLRFRFLLLRFLPDYLQHPPLPYQNRPSNNFLLDSRGCPLQRSGFITAEVRRIVGLLDAHEIKEQVSDQVVERLDSRLAVRDRLLDMRSRTTRKKQTHNQRRSLPPPPLPLHGPVAPTPPATVTSRPMAP